MTEAEQNDKIHKILKYIVIDSVLDSRMVGQPFSSWYFREFKEIEYNEYIIRGLFEILLAKGIATNTSASKVKIDNEKAKTAFHMNTFSPLVAGLIGNQNEVIHKVLNEMYVRFKLLKSFSIESFIRKEYPTNLDYLSEPDRIVEIMVREELITTSETTGIDTLTDFGKQIAESKDGWLGHVKKRDSVEEKHPIVVIKYEKHWYDIPVKIVGFIALAFATYFGISDKYNERTIHELTDSNSQQKLIIDSLFKEVLYRDTLLWREGASIRKHVIDSLRAKK
jgi:hypothetical protein